MDISFPNILAYAAPFFVLTIAIEWGFVRQGFVRGRYAWRDALTSMLMGFGNLATDLAFGFISLGFLLWLWQFRLVDLGVSLPIILLALFAQDFVYYWKHRAMHRVRLFWTAHVVHHSSEHYNLSTALRQPWNNHFTGLVLLSTPLIFLGFHPALIGFIAGINLLYQYWIHTEAIDKCPAWFEAVMNTPSHHRVHHGTNPQYLDANYAGIFIIWDKMFGTFVAEQEETQIHYGLVENIKTYNPITIAFKEMWGAAKDVCQRGIPFSARIKYLLLAPGYSHDGSRKNTELIKSEFVAKNPNMAGTAGLPNAALTEPAE